MLPNLADLTYHDRLYEHLSRLAELQNRPGDALRYFRLHIAAKYLQKFSSLLRLVLENSRSEKITLARDLEALQLYVDIEALRFKEKLRFSLEVAPDIDPTFLQIPGMLIQPHVENAIWHGLMHRQTGGHQTVDFV